MREAVLSEKPQLLYNYFKQLFVQVTNQPIDAIHDEVFADTTSGIGPQNHGPESDDLVAGKLPPDFCRISGIKQY